VTALTAMDVFRPAPNNFLPSTSFPSLNFLSLPLLASPVVISSKCAFYCRADAPPPFPPQRPLSSSTNNNITIILSCTSATPPVLVNFAFSTIVSQSFPSRASSIPESASSVPLDFDGCITVVVSAVFLVAVVHQISLLQIVSSFFPL